MGTALSAGKDRAGGRLDGDDMDMRVDLFQIAADATDGTAGTDTGYKDVDVVAGILPDFRTGRPVMDLGVGGVDELTKNHGTWGGFL